MSRAGASSAGVIRRAWRCRWGIGRLAIAIGLLWVVAIDSGARAARLELAALADMDHAAEGERLLGEHRYSDALLIVEAGLAIHAGEPDESARLASLRERIEGERTGWRRRVRDVLAGALTGAAGDEASIEALLGAVAADFFVFGDVRDLAIQGARAIRGEPTDPVIVALSSVGLATTLAPEVDWAPSLLKAARRAGSLTRGMQDALVRIVRSGDGAGVARVVQDLRALGGRTSPATAARLLKHADDPADLARMARLVEREGAAGAAAVRVTGRGGMEVVRVADGLRSAGRAAEAVRAERVLLKAARKGEAGGRWLRSGGYRALLRPHPLVGLIKGVWKGHAAELLERVLEGLDPRARWLIPLLAAWVFIESGRIVFRVAGGGAGGDQAV